MKHLKYIFVFLGVLVGLGQALAEEPMGKPPQVVAQALANEYRLRVQAQGFVSDLTLFDDMSMLGRAVALPQASVDDSRETIVSGGGEKFPESSGTSSVFLTPSVQLEMSGGVDPLLDLQLRIEAIEKELAQLKHQSVKKEKKTGLDNAAK